jgi:hypothetical protein
MVEQTKDEFEYGNLYDALRVCKETNIGPDRIHTSAMSNEQFDRDLFTLLTQGFVYIGPKLNQYAEGSIMLMLLSVDNDGIESPVYSMLPKVFSVARDNLPERAFVPHQNH